MSVIKCCFTTTEWSDIFDNTLQKCTDPGCKYTINFIFKYFLLVQRFTALFILSHNRLFISEFPIAANRCHVEKLG